MVMLLMKVVTRSLNDGVLALLHERTLWHGNRLNAMLNEEHGGPKCKTETQPSRIKFKTTMKKPGSRRLYASV